MQRLEGVIAVTAIVLGTSLILAVGHGLAAPHAASLGLRSGWGLLAGSVLTMYLAAMVLRTKELPSRYLLARMVLLILAGVGTLAILSAGAVTLLTGAKSAGHSLVFHTSSVLVKPAVSTADASSGMTVAHVVDVQQAEAPQTVAFRLHLDRADADTIGAVIAHSQVILSPGDERLTVRWVPQDDGHPDHTVGLLVAEVGQEHLSKAELITLEVRRSESDTPYRFHWPRGSAVPVPRQQ